MQAYSNIIASVYDDLWGDIADAMGRWLVEACLANLGISRPSSLVDLCCGTGIVSARFLQAGWKVCGVDASPYMLQYANTRVDAAVQEGTASFLLANVAAVDSIPQCEVVTCTFDSLNHLSSFEEVERVFSLARRALPEHGVFIFDVVCDSDMPSEATHYYRGNRSHAIRSHRSGASGIAETVDIFRGTDVGAYVHGQVDLRLLQFDHQAIEQLLRKCGFASLEQTKYSCDGGDQNVLRVIDERTVWIARSS